MLLAGLARRAFNGLNKRVARLVVPYMVKFRPDLADTVKLGVGDGAWRVPKSILGHESICYCVGVGIDVSFDIALAAAGAKVFSFDPTPRSISYMEKLDYDRSRIQFVPIGIWSENTNLKFYAPMNRSHANYSVRDIHSTAEYFVAECRTLYSIMKDHGHERLDLLKLDIEGSWAEVLDSIIRDNIKIGVICVEFDSPTSLSKVLRTISKLASFGFTPVDRDRDNYLFVRS